MSSPHLIQKEQRVGTVYFGFQIGLADGSESEAFLGMDDFDKVEHVLRRCLSGFEYAGITAGSKKEWEDLVRQLGVLSGDESIPERAEIAEELRAFLALGLEQDQPIFVNGV